MYMVVDDNDVIARLRSLADQPLDDRVAAAHLDRATAAAAGGPEHRRTALLAASVAVLVLSAAGIVAARSGDGASDPAGVVDRPTFVEEELACTGPPPFAGQVPDGDTMAERAANRQAEAREFAEWRAFNCPLGDRGSSPTVASSTSTEATTTTTVDPTTTMAMPTSRAPPSTSPDHPTESPDHPTESLDHPTESPDHPTEYPARQKVSPGHPTEFPARQKVCRDHPRR
jgi:hypothetical protein